MENREMGTTGEQGMTWTCCAASCRVSYSCCDTGTRCAHTLHGIDGNALDQYRGGFEDPLPTKLSDHLKP